MGSMETRRGGGSRAGKGDKGDRGGGGRGRIPGLFDFRLTTGVCRVCRVCRVPGCALAQLRHFPRFFRSCRMLRRPIIRMKQSWGRIPSQYQISNIQRPNSRFFNNR